MSIKIKTLKTKLLVVVLTIFLLAFSTTAFAHHKNAFNLEGDQFYKSMKRYYGPCRNGPSRSLPFGAWKSCLIRNGNEYVPPSDVLSSKEFNENKHCDGSDRVYIYENYQNTYRIFSGNAENNRIIDSTLYICVGTSSGGITMVNDKY